MVRSNIQNGSGMDCAILNKSSVPHFIKKTAANDKRPEKCIFSNGFDEPV